MISKIIFSIFVLSVVGYVSARPNFQPYVDQTSSNEEHQLVDTKAVEDHLRKVRMDIIAMANSPMAKMFLNKGMDMMKNNPQIQALLSSDKLKEMLKPETIKKLVNSEAAKNLMKPETLQLAMESPLVKNIMGNAKVKQMLESDALKGYVSKAKEMMPQAMEMAKAQLAKYQ